jgi:hypothetical protein
MMPLLYKHVNPSDSGVVVRFVIVLNHTNRQGVPKMKTGVFCNYTSNGPDNSGAFFMPQHL